MKVKEIFAKYGKTDLLAAKLENSTSTYRAYQGLWLEWYRGFVRKFHKYTVYNGDRKVPKVRRQLGMAKNSCEEWSSLIMSEKTTIAVADENTNKVVKDIFAHNKFRVRFKAGVETAFALGMTAIVERVIGLQADAETGEITDCKNAQVKLDFISGRNIYPLTVDDDGIVECAFLTRKGKKVSISLHLLDDAGNYVIHNIVGKMNEQGDISYDEKTDVYSFNTGSPRPWFQIIKPNIVNNIAPDSPLGISIFANALPQLETCDITFDALPEEFTLGKKRLYIATEALKFSQDGEMTPTFDPNDTLYYALPLGDKPSNEPYVKESNGALRINEISTGIQTALNIYATKVGFGAGHYKYDGGNITTATQVISENSEEYRHLKDHEALVAQVITDCVQAIIYICNTFTATPCKEVCDDDIVVAFDDSIIEDKNAEQMRDMQQVSQRLMSRVEYRMKHFGENEETAKAKIAEIDAGQTSIVDIFGER